MDILGLLTSEEGSGVSCIVIEAELLEEEGEECRAESGNVITTSQEGGIVSTSKLR